MPSMKDVARLAKVSISTVSRVINQNIPVDENTRLRVHGAIEKLNYKPNLLAKGLRVKSGQLIGFVIPELKHPAFINIISYVEEFVVEKGFILIVGNTHYDPDIEERLIDNLIRRNVDGIIVTRVSDESRVLKIIEKSRVPVVVIDRELALQEVSGVILDNYKAGVIAAQHLAGLGHEKVACITGPLNIKLCRDRLNGFRDTLKSCRIELRENNIYEGDFKYESGLEAIRYYLSNNIMFSAIWAQNDLMAVSALKALIENKIKVPQDVSLMGMDDLEIARMVTPSLTTITQPFREMSRTAVEIIFEQRAHPGPVQKIVLEPNLVIRDSTRYMK